MKTVLVIAPHPDDETLGCGGTLSRLIKEGKAVHWLLMTGMEGSSSFTTVQARRRRPQEASSREWPRGT